MKRKRVLLACYSSNLMMSIVAALSPILFVTFKELYHISFGLLGLLVLINFFTQLTIDLIFTFYSSKFNIEKVSKLIPLIGSFGFLIYSIMPVLNPNNAYLYLMIGTIIFSASSGLGEVLLSPIVASLPSDNKEKDMSKLHSIYAWGVVGFVIIGTIILQLIGDKFWFFIGLIGVIVGLFSFSLFCKCELPDLNNQEITNKKLTVNKGIILCAIAIFFSGAAECTMAQWASSYIETALKIPKLIGDIFGTALFSAMLAIGRTLYSQKGKNILNILMIGMFGAFICYIITSLVLNKVISLIACVFCGLCVSMLWPGVIILIGEKYAYAGVAVYALMAAAGDLGAALVPQMVGIITDSVATSDFAFTLANDLLITTEQVGIRSGILIASIFPIFGFIVLLFLKKHLKKSI